MVGYEWRNRGAFGLLRNHAVKKAPPEQIRQQRLATLGGSIFRAS
jgi:hypothetical protein